MIEKGNRRMEQKHRMIVAWRMLTCAMVIAVLHFSFFVTLEAQEVLLPLNCGAVEQPHGLKNSNTVSLPFFDDFATGSVDTRLWEQGGGANVTMDVSPLAPTVGTLTLDAIAADGRLYPSASTNLFPADTICSRPIRLDGMGVDDSVVLSFYYLPGGGYGNLWERVGETPGKYDSVFLDFYSVADSAWHTVWCRGGTCVDSLIAHTGFAWQYVSIPIVDDGYCDSNFRFRFRNYASLAATSKPGLKGNCDYWHIDYVMVGRGRDTSATAIPDFRDIAFAAPAQSSLVNYRAMPYRQYVAAEMAQTMHLDIVNLFGTALASQYGYEVFDAAGNSVYAYDGGYDNAPPFLPDGTYQTAAAHATPPVNFSFPPMNAPAEYTIVHTVREGTGGDAHRGNDTVRYNQVFAHQYAYDDGTAENGYGLTSTASRLYLAYRFDLHVADTLTAVDMWFNHTFGDENEAVPFYITVWSMGSDGRPDEVLYRDNTRRKPQYGGFAHYALEHPVMVSGHIFVGFEQSGNDYINLGFDRSFNTADRIYYHTSTDWQRSILSGSLMIRPGFGVAALPVGVGVVAMPEVTLRPNPVADILYIDRLLSGARVEVFDMQGRRMCSTTECRIDVSAWAEGVYIVRVIQSMLGVHTSKIVVKH